MLKSHRVKVKRVRETSRVPEYQTTHSAGADLYADIVEPVVIGPGERVMIPTGVAMQIPEGYYGEVHDRSGWATRYGITTMAGVIDSDYTGEVQVVLLNTGSDSVTIHSGDRIAQLVIKPYVKADLCTVDQLDDTERGAGGFGSTGL